MLKNNGRRFFKRAAERLYTNSGRNLCTKFMKNRSIGFLSGNALINLGLPKKSNFYGNKSPHISS